METPLDSVARVTRATGATNGTWHNETVTITLAYLATDAAGNTETLKTLTINVDTQAPTTPAPWSAWVHRGRVVALRSRVSEAAPTCGLESIVLKIADRRGPVIMTLDRVARRGADTYGRRFRCSLPRGEYRFTVFATDGAGNPQAAASTNVLHVRQ